MMTDGAKLFEDMNTRSREVFRRVVEGYLENGEPMGSRTLTRTLTEKVSAATVRNVMQDLEYLGLLDSPHISAGRIPTQMGLRIFVDGLLEIGEMNVVDREKLMPLWRTRRRMLTVCWIRLAQHCQASLRARHWF